MTFHITRKESLGDALRRVAEEQIGAAIRDIENTDADPDFRVHQFRKRCKKMRGLLRLIRPALGDRFEAEDARFREAARLLSAARDATVTDRSIALAAPDGATTARPESVDVTDETFSACAAAARSALSAVPTWPLDACTFADLRSGFEATYRRLNRARERALAAPSGERYHKVRKWTKYHWYQIRLLEHANRRRYGKRRELLRRTGCELGDAHDLDVALGYIASNGSGDRELRRRLLERRSSLMEDAGRHLKTVTRADPQTLARNLERDWQKWRGTVAR